VNLKKKLISQSTTIQSPVPIQALLHSLKNTLGSSPLLPLKIGITMWIEKNSFKKQNTHQIN
jgi:hypothetical protein